MRVSELCKVGYWNKRRTQGVWLPALPAVSFQLSWDLHFTNCNVFLIARKHVLGEINFPQVWATLMVMQRKVVWYSWETLKAFEVLLGKSFQGEQHAPPWQKCAVASAAVLFQGAMHPWDLLVQDTAAVTAQRLIWVPSDSVSIEERKNTQRFNGILHWFHI